MDGFVDRWDEIQRLDLFFFSLSLLLGTSISDKLLGVKFLLRYSSGTLCLPRIG